MCVRVFLLMAVLAAVASAQTQAMKLLVVPLELASVPKIAEFEPTEVEQQIYAFPRG